MSFGWDAPPRVVAHRGSPLHAPENTLASFQRAVGEGARAVELDARLTRDGGVVVHHDAELGRIFSGSGLVEDKSLDELRALGVPTLRDVLRALPASTLFEVELKPDAENALVLPERVHQLVREERAIDRVLATSFDPSLATDYAERADRAAGFIVPFPLMAEDVESWPRLTHIVMAQDALLPEVIESLRARTLHAWTVNDERAALELVRAGVATIITDRPAAMLAALAF